MRQFIKFMFASCFGVLLAFIAAGVLGGIAVTGLVSSAEKKVDVKANSVLKLSFNQAIPEQTNNVSKSAYDINTDDVLGLHEIVAAIKNAKEDDKIKGIFLNVKGLSTYFATASALREALEDFKSSEKFIVTYSDSYSRSSYYLSSVADKIYVNPLGGVDFIGYAAEIPFFKEMIDRLNIKVQVYYAGQFKSATEPYRLKEMSPQNRLQVKEYMNDVYNIFLSDISRSRDVSVSELRSIADEYLVRSADDAVKYKLADAVGYYDEALDDMRTRIGLEEKDKLKMIELSDYAPTVKESKDYSIKDKIAVVIAEGSIVGGEGDAGNIGGDKYAAIFRKLRKDKKIKAVVLRVNSGGGSAMASEIMWRELGLLREAGKPVVVSMGDLAASGGYYIACNADSIIAAPNTITGSIGVFSLIPSLQGMLKDKVGVTFDTVKTGKYSTGISLFRDISEDEGKILQTQTDAIYETFLKRVSDARNMTRDEAHAIAQGRVWTGERAKEIGLVDSFGDLNDAIEAAAFKAGLEKYRTSEYPRVKDPLKQMIEKLTGKKEDAVSQVMYKQLGELYPYYKELKDMKEMKGVQARMPYMIEFK